ncbi:MAG: hypothetical protein B7Y43_18685 [Sphingomonas sp. 28-62-20]|uniref:TIR domain-containing protein n=1 Tax=Sphingomonas sp. 28-62-20 TaxID=1970433 RepID=UPI000BD40DF6|nr:MAG: hypothetical protein B7Y43_18685 [Sphingomonas sp. 28-62-20]
MAYRNKTYTIFDGDKDMWAYAYMKGWKANRHIDFDFYDAHDIQRMPRAQDEAYVKAGLRQRLENTKQAIVLCGESTKNLYRFVRWEIEICLEKRIPIIVANLNKTRSHDPERCPPILNGKGAMHVAFGARIIKFALDNYADNPIEYKSQTNWYYEDKVYKSLGYD